MAGDYTDLLIRIFAWEEQDGFYPVEAELDDGSRFSGGRLKIDRAALVSQQLDARAYGQTLFEALFAGEMRRAYDRATGRAEAGKGGRLRVRLWIDAQAVELHALQWERLHHPLKGQLVPLTTSALTPFSRYTSLETQEPKPVAETPLKMLIVVANPAGLPAGLTPVDVEAELENLRRGLSELRRTDRVQITALPGRTGLSAEQRARLEVEDWDILEGAASLDNVIRYVTGCHILHFIGHGDFKRKKGEERGPGFAWLHLEKDDGSWQAVRDDEIVARLAGVDPLPHLTFLVACESATRDAAAEHPFIGLAPRLVQIGLPAIVAMQEKVPIVTARELAAEFYRRLVEHGEVDRALNQARQVVFEAKRTDWAIPVLFSRVRTGKLFGADVADEAPAPGAPPFKGLTYFTESDADKFYGRELLTARLVGKLRASRFLPVIIGGSGSGKSSVVRAGVLPALKRGAPLADGTLPPEGSSTWPVFVLVPSAQPLEALAAALTRDAESVTATAALVDDLKADERALHYAVRKLLGRTGGDRLLIVVDQFEEIFTLCKDPVERKAFVDNLLYASAPDTDGPTMVIVVFRADFYAHCAQFQNLREAVSTNQEFVGPMTPAELRRTIEEPARVGGWDLEPGLVDTILREVGEEPGALPLMQHALLETWKRRRGRMMTLRGYAEAGGIRGAIAKTAEAVYKAMPPEQQAIARRIFLRLVELGEGTQDTRRRARLDELYGRDEQRPWAEAVLKRLVDNRLVVTTQNTAEVAHEALIREWPTLRGWLNESRESLRVQRELLEAAEDWERDGRDEGALYRGVRLIQAIEWSEENPNELSGLEREFLAASRDIAEREAREKEERQQRELEAARRLAEEQKLVAAKAQEAAEAARQAREAAEKLAASEKDRAEERERAWRTLRRRAVYLAAALGVAVLLAVVAFGATVFANQQQQIAVREAENARQAEATAVAERDRADQAKQEAVIERDRAVAAEQEAEAERDRAVAAEQEAERQAGIAENRALIAASFNSLDADPQASLILAREALAGAADAEGQAEAKDALYQAYEASRLTEIVSLADVAYRLAYSPASDVLAVGRVDGVLELYPGFDLSQEPGVIQGASPIWSVEFRPDGGALLAGYDDGMAVVWNLADGQALLTINHQAAVVDVAWEPEGRWFATAGLDGLVDLWDPATGALIEELGSDEEYYDTLAVSPDGSLLAAADAYYGLVAIWRMRAGSFVSVRPVYLFSPHEQLTAMSFAPDGRLVTGGVDGLARSWDIAGFLAARDAGQVTEAGRPAYRDFAGHSAGISQIAFSAGGRWMATASYDWQVRVWDMASGRSAYTLTGHQGAVYGVAFSGDPIAPLLATSGRDGTLRLWYGDLAGGVAGYDLQSPVAGVSFSSTGQAAYGLKDGRVVLDSSEAEDIVLPAHTRGVTGLAFDERGDRLVSAGADAQAVLIDAATGAVLLTVTHGDDFPVEIEAVDLSADGRWIATGGRDGVVRVWDAGNGAAAARLETAERRVNAVAFNPDGQRLAAGTVSGSVFVWEWATGQTLYKLEEHFSSVNDVAFSLDGARLATADDDGLILLWDLETGELAFEIQAHSGQVYGLEFTGAALVSVGSDRAVKFWEVSTGEETLTIGGAPAAGSALSLSPDGRTLAVAGGDGVVRFYPLDSGDLAEAVDGAIHRPLTEAECERFRLAGAICAEP